MWGRGSCPGSLGDHPPHLYPSRDPQPSDHRPPGLYRSGQWLAWYTPSLDPNSPRPFPSAHCLLCPLGHHPGSPPAGPLHPGAPQHLLRRPPRPSSNGRGPAFRKLLAPHLRGEATASCCVPCSPLSPSLRTCDSLTPMYLWDLPSPGPENPKVLSCFLVAAGDPDVEGERPTLRDPEQKPPTALCHGRAGSQQTLLEVGDFRTVTSADGLGGSRHTTAASRVP